MHVLLYLVVFVVGGALGYLYGPKVEADVKSDVAKVEADVKKL